MAGAPKPLLAIVGRPNVGKSTLYNRLVGGRPAMVHDTPGLTRDRRYGELDYFGHELRVVDTGGLDPEAEREVIGAGIHRQAHLAIQESDAVIFVVDATAGITPLDREVAAMLRKTGLPVLCAANKIDHQVREVLAAEIYGLGMGDVYAISAAHGRGVDELIEAVVAVLELPPPVHEQPPEHEPWPDEEPEADAEAKAAEAEAAAAERELRVAFLGKPNAGKSSLMNRLVGVERSLVHHVPGTTTDPVDTPFEFAGTSYVLVDTAGIRRKGKIDADAEKIAVSMALGQIRRADVVVLVVDGSLGLSEQDARLAGAIEQNGRAVVVALNKSDLLDGPGAGKELRQQAADELHFISYAPYVLVSALRGEGLGKLMSEVDRVAAEHARRVSTGELNRFFAEVLETHPPPVHKGRAVRINYLTQGGVRPPTFLLWASRPDGVSPSYRRFIANQLRARYGFEGTPLRVIVKSKKRSKSKRTKGKRSSRRR